MRKSIHNSVQTLNIEEMSQREINLVCQELGIARLRGNDYAIVHLKEIEEDVKISVSEYDTYKNHFQTITGAFKH